MKTIIPNWPAPKNVKAFASTRIGGFSTGPYQGLNLGTHVGGDDLSLVEKNRAWLAQQASMPNAPIWLNQTHSTVVAQANEPTTQVLDADGVFTSSSHVVCSAMTADCLPVLLTNTQGTQVAAVHAGWRGLANGIVENALALFSGEVIAWLGPPAIGLKPSKWVKMFCKLLLILIHRRIKHLLHAISTVNGLLTCRCWQRNV